MAAIHRILCPIDRSETSIQALREAATLARQHGASLFLLYVAQPLSIPNPDVVGPVEWTLPEDREAAIRRWMDADARMVAPDLTAIPMVDVGQPADEIVAAAAELEADLIVLGTHGHSGIRRLWLGSVTERVLHRSPCAVLTVPPHVDAAPRPRFERVLCAIDFSDCSIQALDVATTTTLAANAELVLAHVLTWPWHEPPTPAFDELPTAEAATLMAYRTRREREALDHLQAIEPADAKPRCVCAVAHGDPAGELLRLADAHRADLIVIGVHGRSPIDMVVFGSTANHVIRRARCPVLTVPLRQESSHV